MTVDILWDREGKKNSALLSFLTLVHAHLTHSVNTERCETPNIVNSLTVISLTELYSGTIQTLRV